MSTTTRAVELHPFTEGDAVAASDLSDRVWRAYDAARDRPARPAATDDEIERSQRRFAWQARTDPADSYAAWQGDRLVGVGLARRREAFWGLSLLIVDPEVQGQGVGARLLAAALRSADGAHTAMISSSEDARAIARYRLAGFRLHPALRAAGRLDRAALPSIAGLRDGGPHDHDAIDGVGRRLRGGGYGDDLTMFAQDARLLIVERGTRLAWAFVHSAAVEQVGGTDVDIARDALFAALASAEPDEPADSRGNDAVVRHMTAEQDWAVEAVLAAGLRLEPSGPLCMRGPAPPSPYLPNGMIF